MISKCFVLICFPKSSISFSAILKVLYRQCLHLAYKFSWSWSKYCHIVESLSGSESSFFFTLCLIFFFYLSKVGASCGVSSFGLSLLPKTGLKAENTRSSFEWFVTKWWRSVDVVCEADLYIVWHNKHCILDLSNLWQNSQITELLLNCFGFCHIGGISNL